MKVVDLFAGSGGMSQGFEDAGFELVAAFENWEPAIATYRENFDHPVYKLDLSDFEGAAKLLASEFSPDVIIGGPPCQDFSHAGKRVESARADLTVSFAEIVARVRPKFFVMENVDRAKDSFAFSLAKDVMRGAGYGLILMTLDASRYGTPQRRKRFFCIGGLGLPDDFIDVPVESLASDNPMTLRQFFGESLDFENYYRHPRNYSRRAVFSVDEPAPTMRGVNRPVPNGYPGHPNDSVDVKSGVRPLTTMERAAIQTFPPTFTWVGPKTHVEQLIGNAVPVRLAKFVASYLKDFIDGNNVSYTGEDFAAWLGQSGRYQSPRSQADVVSRVKRADGLLPLPLTSNPDYLHELDKQSNFSLLKPTVRSQLKGAVKSYFEFLSDTSELATV